MAVVKRKIQGARRLERYLIALAGTRGEIAGGIDKARAEVHAGNPAAKGPSEKTRRPANA